MFRLVSIFNNLNVPHGRYKCVHYYYYTLILTDFHVNFKNYGIILQQVTCNHLCKNKLKYYNVVNIFLHIFSSRFTKSTRVLLLYYH